jgi:hypothetical protein
MLSREPLEGSMDLVVVDGPNLLNSAGAILAREFPSGEVRRYLQTWFDIDRFLAASLKLKDAPTLGIVVFHSTKAVGRSSFRLEKPMPFWGRQGSNPNTSCTLVDLSGTQQDTYLFECESCHQSNTARTTSEKGIDTAITTHLLDTADRWESACIVSDDVDFVPPVVSLRRRGKRMFCAVNDFSRDQAGTALVQACQSHFTLSEEHLVSDYRTFRMCQQDGELDRLVSAAAENSLPQIQIRLLNLVPMRGRRRLHVQATTAENRELDPAELQRLADRILGGIEESGFELQPIHNPEKGIHFYGTEDVTLLDGFERHVDAVDPRPTWTQHFAGRSFR